MNKRSMNTNLDSKLGQGTSERGRSQVETHLSTVIFNDRFTARILGYSSNFLKSVEKNSRERVRFIPIRPLVERIPMVSRNSKKKGGTRRDLPKGEKLPRSISHGQLPPRYSPNIDCASAPKANLRLSRSREKAFTLFYNAIRQNQSSIPIVFLVQRLRDPDFAPSKISRGGSLETGRSFQLIRSDNRATLNGRVTGILYPVFITFAVKTIKSGAWYLVSFNSSIFFKELRGTVTECKGILCKFNTNKSCNTSYLSRQSLHTLCFFSTIHL